MSRVATNSRRLMRSSCWFVVGLVPPTASIAPRWTYGCEVKNLDFTTDGRAHHYELTSAGHDLFKVCVSLGGGGHAIRAFCSTSSPGLSPHPLLRSSAPATLDLRTTSTQLANSSRAVRGVDVRVRRVGQTIGVAQPGPDVERVTIRVLLEPERLVEKRRRRRACLDWAEVLAAYELQVPPRFGARNREPLVERDR